MPYPSQIPLMDTVLLAGLIQCYIAVCKSHVFNGILANGSTQLHRTAS